MEVSIFLAKALGLYLVIVGAGMLINGEKFRKMLLPILKDPGMVLFTGFLALIVGIPMVIIHNLWVMDWRVLITILAWLTLIKGAVRMFFPEFVINQSTRFIKKKGLYNGLVAFMLALGALLLYLGYMHH